MRLLLAQNLHLAKCFWRSQQAKLKAIPDLCYIHNPGRVESRFHVNSFSLRFFTLLSLRADTCYTVILVLVKAQDMQ
jgi:hypothetical protein